LRASPPTTPVSCSAGKCADAQWARWLGHARMKQWRLRTGLSSRKTLNLFVHTSAPARLECAASADLVETLRQAKLLEVRWAIFGVVSLRKQKGHRVRFYAIKDALAACFCHGSAGFLFRPQVGYSQGRR
jgi:hypothetical protein